MAAATTRGLLVGTSGWQYRSWRDEVYEGRPQSRWLAAYAERFPTVEVNASFYRLPSRDTCRRWAEETPPGFRFSLKVSRYLSHVRRLRDPAEPVARFLDRAAGLGDKLAVALLQLPPDLAVDVGRLDGLLARWPRDLRLAVEFRHPSWFCDEIQDLLVSAGVAACRTDRAGRPGEPPWRTAPWCYLRLHEGRARPRPCYGDAALRAWVRRVQASWGRHADGFVYFNNDPLACAPRNAARFAVLAARLGSSVNEDP